MKFVPTEEQEQMALVQYLELKGLKFTAIPNNTFTLSWNQKNKNKRTGLRPGLPDLLIIVKNTLVFIEMKRTKGSTISTEQKAWIFALNKICPHVVAQVCHGVDEAIPFIENIIKYESDHFQKNKV